MRTNSDVGNTRFEGLKRFFFGLFGVNEVLFLAGFGAFFHGMRGLWSLEGAFAVSGVILMAIAIGGIIFANRGSK